MVRRVRTPPGAFLLWLFLLPLAAPGGAAETRTLSLSQAVETALRSHPATKASAAGREMASATLREARTGWLPGVQAAAGYTRSNNPVFVFGSLLEQERFGPGDFSIDKLNDPAPYNNLRGTLSLRLPLFDQLRTWTRVAQARVGGEQAAQRFRGVEQQVRFEVIRAYYGVLVAEAKQKVTEDATTTAEADVRRVSDLFDAGLVVRSDLLAAQVQLSEYQHERIQAAGELAVAHAALNTSLGLPILTVSTLSGTLGDPSFEVAEPTTLVSAALENRADYAWAEASVRSAQAALRGANGQYLPRLEGFAQYGGSGKSLEIDSTDYTMGVALTVDLLDLGRAPRVDQARAGVSLASAERQQTANRIQLEVVQAYERYRAARDRQAVAAGAVNQAAEARRIVQERYQAGLTTITEVLRAGTALLKAQTNALGARYDLFVGFANVLLASGGLDDVRPFEP